LRRCPDLHKKRSECRGEGEGRLTLHRVRGRMPKVDWLCPWQRADLSGGELESDRAEATSLARMHVEVKARGATTRGMMLDVNKCRDYDASTQLPRHGTWPPPTHLDHLTPVDSQLQPTSVYFTLHPIPHSLCSLPPPSPSWRQPPPPSHGALLVSEGRSGMGEGAPGYTPSTRVAFHPQPTLPGSPAGSRTRFIC
jgi:hypothetical protein